MRKFKKTIAAFVAVVLMAGTPIAPKAAEASNLDANEQAVLEWIAANAEGGKESTIYEIAKDQFEYTEAELSDENAQIIKNAVKEASKYEDAKATDENKAAIAGYAKEAAQAAGGDIIAISDADTLDESVVFVRYNNEDPTVIEEMVTVQEDEVVPYKPEGDVVVSGVKYEDINGVFTPVVDVVYSTHVQSIGDQAAVKNGEMSGTEGQAKRLEAISIDIEGNDDLGITYTTHCQTYSWLPWSSNGEANGTKGEAKRLEAIEIQLTGADKDAYNVYYRVHAQSYGWLEWAKNGERAGTAGYAKRLEGIQIVVLHKSVAFDGTAYKYTSTNEKAYYEKEGSASETPAQVVPTVMYKTHVQTQGWQTWVTNGVMSGTTGVAKRLEGINIQLTNKDCDGSIVYTTHVQTYGWQQDTKDQSTWKKDGEMAGTTGEAKRLEAICINLTGEMAEKYDVYYRVHSQTFGWLAWAKNGEAAGTAGYAKRLEGIQVVLVEKGAEAPGNVSDIVSTNDQAYIQK